MRTPSLTFRCVLVISDAWSHEPDPDSRSWATFDEMINLKSVSTHGTGPTATQHGKNLNKSQIKSKYKSLVWFVLVWFRCETHQQTALGAELAGLRSPAFTATAGYIRCFRRNGKPLKRSPGPFRGPRTLPASAALRNTTKCKAKVKVLQNPALPPIHPAWRPLDPSPSASCPDAQLPEGSAIFKSNMYVIDAIKQSAWKAFQVYNRTKKRNTPFWFDTGATQEAFFYPLVKQTNPLFVLFSRNCLLGLLRLVRTWIRW